MDTRWRRGLITVIWKFPVGEWAATLDPLQTGGQLRDLATRALR